MQTQLAQAKYKIIQQFEDGKLSSWEAQIKAQIAEREALDNLQFTALAELLG